jgi:hypothetical protein
LRVRQELALATKTEPAIPTLVTIGTEMSLTGGNVYDGRYNNNSNSRGNVYDGRYNNNSNSNNQGYGINFRRGNSNFRREENRRFKGKKCFIRLCEGLSNQWQQK